MSAIGGYFEWEAGNGMAHYHPDALQLNTARNALYCILQARSYSKVYLPEYICDVLLQPIERSCVTVEYYRLNKILEPDLDVETIDPNALFLYTNYFGLRGDTVFNLSRAIKNLVIDNAQAFFAKPLPGVNTLYSPRKFFGVPDGAFLYAEDIDVSNLPLDISYDRCAHLLKRLDVSAEAGFNDFKKNEDTLGNLPPCRMSVLTSEILSNIDYAAVAQKRRSNYEYLAIHLDQYNEVRFDLTEDAVPMCYPFLQAEATLYDKLVQHSVFIPRLWPHLLLSDKKDSVAFLYASSMLALPIDQRLQTRDLDSIIKLIK